MNTKKQLNVGANRSGGVIGFNNSRTHFDVIESEEIAVAMLAIGNEQGIDRVCRKLPAGTVAVMTQSSKTTITLIAPNGDKITRSSGRIDAKRTMEKLKELGVKTFNIKKGGAKVEC